MAKTLPAMLVAWAGMALAAPVAPPGADAAAALLSRAAALTPDVPHGRILYLERCAACHSPRGWGDGPREIPALAGQRERYLLEQMARFLSGARPELAMHGPAMHEALSPGDVDRPQALRDLAGYLARAQPDPRPEHGDGRTLAAGGQDYRRDCSGCHGDGAGSDATGLPRLGGQHFHYLRAQLRGFAAIHRGVIAPDAAARTAPGAGEREAIADYLSRLTYPPADHTP
jgi:cytochrome c553